MLQLEEIHKFKQNSFSKMFSDQLYDQLHFSHFPWFMKACIYSWLMQPYLATRNWIPWLCPSSVSILWHPLPKQGLLSPPSSCCCLLPSTTSKHLPTSPHQEEPRSRWQGCTQQILACTWWSLEQKILVADAVMAISSTLHCNNSFSPSQIQ